MVHTKQTTGASDLTVGGPFSLMQKVVVISGGSGMLGMEFTKAFEAAGARVVSFDKKASDPVDITDPDAVQDKVLRVVKEYGTIDVLVNAAALDAVAGSPASAAQFSPYEKFPLDLWQKELSVNLTGNFIVTQKVAQVMMQQKHGSIIFVASDLALIAPHNDIYDEGKFKDIAYITSKAGILGMMRAWAAYLAPYDVRVNAVAPGGVFNGQPEAFVKKNAAQNMLGRMARQDEYNGLLVFLASAASSYMTGTCIVADGGRTAW